MFQRDRAWFVVRDDPPNIPALDQIQQHNLDELVHAPTPTDIHLAEAKAMSIFTHTIEDSLLGRFLHVKTLLQFFGLPSVKCVPVTLLPAS